jgi:dTDP-4-amino-4,6-dideoxygalactose transaminase
MSKKIPFHLPSISEEEIAEVVDTLRSGWLTTGPKTRRFEREFSEFVGARHAVALNSCTAGLHLALEAVGVRAGDEVIIPTYTFTAAGEVVTYLGATPVLADVRRDTFNIDVSTIESHITSRTKAIIPVHLAGQACDMDPILQLAKRYGLYVIEDAAHSFPATYKGRTIGTVGDVTSFSFYATKTITTGEGGMITTDREDLAERIRQMSLHGLSKSAWNRYGSEGNWHYEVLEFGFKYNMTDIAAALGVCQLRRAEQFRARRSEIAATYSRAFSDLDGCTVPREGTDSRHAWHLYILLMDPRRRGGRESVVSALGRRGIGTSVHFIPLHLHPAYQKTLGYSTGDFPNAEWLFERAVSLPIYPKMTDDDVAMVIDAVRQAWTDPR